MSPLLISIAVFVGVTALVGAVAMLIRDSGDKGIESRLDMLTGSSMAASLIESEKQATLLTRPLEGNDGWFEGLTERFRRLGLLFEQADTTLTPTAFFVISSSLAGLGWIAAWLAGSPFGLLPISAVACGVLPLGWLIMRRRKRMRKFAQQLPDALELIGRALRAGHSLSSGFHLVSEEMPEPMGREFGRVFEENNLGVDIDDSLRSMTDRIPNLDLKFFVTAVVLQRQTGGDLAEILDKIGHLIRERFQIWGQVQALTGEGRLSGIVLLALPPLLFIAVYRLNPDYIMLLFTDPMGKQMLAIAIVLQLLGALVIRKIVNIKV